MLNVDQTNKSRIYDPRCRIISEMEIYLKLQWDPSRFGVDFYQESISGAQEMIDPYRADHIKELIEKYEMASGSDFWSWIGQNEIYRRFLPVRAHVEFVKLASIRRKYCLDSTHSQRVRP